MEQTNGFRGMRRMSTVAVVAVFSSVAIAAPLSPSDRVIPTDRTPGLATSILKSPNLVSVFSFTLPGAADDDAVATAVRSTARSSTAGPDLRIFMYTVTHPGRFGDLPEILNVEGSPSVIVVRDGQVVARWLGLVDTQVIRQSIRDASKS